MLTGFTAALVLITLSELGDKSFLITALLAMRYPRWLVFWGTIAALGLMTIISAVMGQVSQLFPKIYVHWAEVLLLAGFGILSIWQASQMKDSGKTCETELEEAKAEIEEKESLSHNNSWFDRQLGSLLGSNSKRILATFAKSFTLVFIAEWGDRTQFTTIALAAGNNPIAVTVGAILGHGICSAIAVIAGCLLASYLSERIIMFLGGILFLIFAGVAYFEPM
ncbi:MAG: TMEM165/GDT1 family protein [Pseudanabaenaceae cyanobacterium]|jgi:putative Ca2+/H+ antiporter (TMEM165/GDT1 family)